MGKYLDDSDMFHKIFLPCRLKNTNGFIHPGDANSTDGFHNIKNMTNIESNASKNLKLEVKLFMLII